MRNTRHFFRRNNNRRMPGAFSVGKMPLSEGKELKSFFYLRKGIFFRKTVGISRSLRKKNRRPFLIIRGINFLASQELKSLIYPSNS